MSVAVMAADDERADHRHAALQAVQGVFERD
jgi:hypothetical protein